MSTAVALLVFLVLNVAVRLWLPGGGPIRVHGALDQTN